MFQYRLEPFNILMGMNSLMIVSAGVKNTNAKWSDQCAGHRPWSPRSLGPVSGERPRLLHIAHCHQTSAETEDREAHVSDQCANIRPDWHCNDCAKMSHPMYGEESSACMRKWLVISVDSALITRLRSDIQPLVGLGPRQGLQASGVISVREPG